MTRTLYGYISRDLAKVTLMALVPFTLVLTVFGVSEPLREQGLSGMQVLSLFGYTIPATLSLTLPIASLLGGTLVYGRFSQQNEFLAARASGISAVRLLKPAMALGMLVTVLSLVLSCYVTPALIRRGAKSAMDDVEGLVFQQLRVKNYIQRPGQGQYVHATRINAERREVRGVVAADISNPDDVRFLIAPVARIKFGTVDGKRYATFVLSEAVAASSGSYDIVRVGDTEMQSVPLQNMGMRKEDVSWYDLDELVATLKNPTLNRQIRSSLVDIRRNGCKEALAGRIVAAINGGGSYRLTDGRYDYIISASGAGTGGEGVVKLFSRDVLQGVRVVVLREGVVRKRVMAESGKVLAKWSDWSSKLMVAMELRGIVSVQIGDRDLDSERRSEWDFEDAQQRSSWDVGDLEMPPDIVRKFSGDSLADVYDNPGAYTSDKRLLGGLAYRLRGLATDIKAEMHVRVAYGLSCCLMVAMGASLGLMFRGGQLLSAFALAIVPAAVVIIMIVMGKELMKNKGVDPLVGLQVIWGGLVLLLAGNTFIYWRLMRR